MLKLKMNCCPNSECQKTLENIIILNEDSTDPPKINFACPHCGFKLDPTTTTLFQKEETRIKEKTETKKRQPKTKKPSECPKYFGYLNNGLKDSIILKKCLICPKMADCMLNKKDPVRIS
jgi:hypothetical protein